MVRCWFDTIKSVKIVITSIKFWKIHKRCWFCLLGMIVYLALFWKDLEPSKFQVHPNQCCVQIRVPRVVSWRTNLDWFIQALAPYLFTTVLLWWYFYVQGTLRGTLSQAQLLFPSRRDYIKYCKTLRLLITDQGILKYIITPLNN